MILFPLSCFPDSHSSSAVGDDWAFRARNGNHFGTRCKKMGGAAALRHNIMRGTNSPPFAHETIRG